MKLDTEISPSTVSSTTSWGIFCTRYCFPDCSSWITVDSPNSVPPHALFRMEKLSPHAPCIVYVIFPLRDNLLMIISSRGQLARLNGMKTMFHARAPNWVSQRQSSYMKCSRKPPCTLLVECWSCSYLVSKHTFFSTPWAARETRQEPMYAINTSL